jgi:dethiobiotin synthetase
MVHQYFIIATGTDIGKSFYLQKLCGEYEVNKQSFHAIKPIISGFDIDDLSNDSSLILEALKLENNLDNLNKISPWRFKAALSPNIAAQMEDKEIELDDVINFCQNEIYESSKSKKNLLIEGAGGVMTPINNNSTFLDLIKAVNIPVILVTANYLGTISHTLSTIKVLESENIKISKIIFNKRGEVLSDQNNLENLKNFTKIEIEEI